MKTHAPTTFLLAAMLALAAGHAAEPIASTATPDADGILRKMSARLAAAREFSFHAHRHSHGAVLPGHMVPEDVHIWMAVKRPDRIVAKTRGHGGPSLFYFDGRTLTLHDGSKNFYATAPMRGSIDDMLAGIHATFGFTPPLAELAASNIYEDMRRKVHRVEYLGEGRIPGGFLGLGGVRCHRVHLAGSMRDAELWVGVEDYLPRKLVVSFNQKARTPRLTAVIDDWNLAPRLSDGTFVFQPPEGARKIPMLTTAEMKAARSSTPKKN
jgi:hypothetical protein